jgi:hypothetical protein
VLSYRSILANAGSEKAGMHSRLTLAGVSMIKLISFVSAKTAIVQSKAGL